MLLLLLLPLYRPINEEEDDDDVVVVDKVVPGSATTQDAAIWLLVVVFVFVVGESVVVFNTSKSRTSNDMVDWIPPVPVGFDIVVSELVIKSIVSIVSECSLSLGSDDDDDEV